MPPVDVTASSGSSYGRTLIPAGRAIEPADCCEIGADTAVDDDVDASEEIDMASDPSS